MTAVRKYTTNQSQKNIISSKPMIKSLLKSGRKATGRANGRISIRHRGGGTRPRYRALDFNGTDKLDIPGVVRSIEYDPNRTAFVSLIVFADGDKRYQLCPQKQQIGDTVMTAHKAKASSGNRMQLKNIPVGFTIFNIELVPNCGGQLVRSAGQSAKLVSLDGNKAQIQLPSGEIRLFHKDIFATLGTVSNEESSLQRVLKAGSTRNAGRRPQVRGKAMNPCDHPHGGGEGGAPIGMKHPKTPWGAPALGVKTRARKHRSNSLILSSRHRAKKRQ